MKKVTVTKTWNKLLSENIGDGALHSQIGNTENYSQKSQFLDEVLGKSVNFNYKF